MDENLPSGDAAASSSEYAHVFIAFKQRKRKILGLLLCSRLL